MDCTQRISFSDDNDDGGGGGTGLADQSVVVARLVSLPSNEQDIDEVIELKNALNTLGRDPEQCNIHINNKTLSRIHAIFEPDSSASGGFLLFDNGSSNGTWRGQNRLTKKARYEVKDGDELAFGSLRFRFEVVKCASADAAEDDEESFIAPTQIMERDALAVDHPAYVPETPAAQNGTRSSRVGEANGNTSTPSSRASSIPESPFTETPKASEAPTQLEPPSDEEESVNEASSTQPITVEGEKIASAAPRAKSLLSVVEETPLAVDAEKPSSSAPKEASVTNPEPSKISEEESDQERFDDDLFFVSTQEDKRLKEQTPNTNCTEAKEAEKDCSADKPAALNDSFGSDATESLLSAAVEQYDKDQLEASSATHDSDLTYVDEDFAVSRASLALAREDPANADTQLTTSEDDGPESSASSPEMIACSQESGPDKTNFVSLPMELTRVISSPAVSQALKKSTQKESSSADETDPSVSCMDVTDSANQDEPAVLPNTEEMNPEATPIDCADARQNEGSVSDETPGSKAPSENSDANEPDQHPVSASIPSHNEEQTSPDKAEEVKDAARPAEDKMEGLPDDPDTIEEPKRIKRLSPNGTRSTSPEASPAALVAASTENDEDDETESEGAATVKRVSDIVPSGSDDDDEPQEMMDTDSSPLTLPSSQKISDAMREENQDDNAVEPEPDTNPSEVTTERPTRRSLRDRKATQYSPAPAADNPKPPKASRKSQSSKKAVITKSETSDSHGTTTEAADKSMSKRPYKRSRKVKQEAAQEETSETATEAERHTPAESDAQKASPSECEPSKSETSIKSEVKTRKRSLNTDAKDTDTDTPAQKSARNQEEPPRTRRGRQTTAAAPIEPVRRSGRATKKPSRISSQEFVSSSSPSKTSPSPAASSRARGTARRPAPIKEEADPEPSAPATEEMSEQANEENATQTRAGRRGRAAKKPAAAAAKTGAKPNTKVEKEEPESESRAEPSPPRRARRGGAGHLSPDKKTVRVKAEPVSPAPAPSDKSARSQRSRRAAAAATVKEEPAEAKTKPRATRRSQTAKASEGSDKRKRESGEGAASAKRTRQQSESTEEKSGSVNSRLSASSRLRGTLVYKVMFTGYDEPSLRKAVTGLGGKITDDVHECNVLVSDKVRRTAKFLCMVAKGVPIVSPEWIKSSRTTKAFKDPWQYIISDPESEKKWAFNLRNTLTASRKSPLLADYRVHATKSVKPPSNEIKDIVEFAGGQWVSRVPSSEPAANDLVIISIAEDVKKACPSKRSLIPVQSNEILLSGLLRRELDFDKYRLVV